MPDADHWQIETFIPAAPEQLLPLLHEKVQRSDRRDRVAASHDALQTALSAIEWYCEKRSRRDQKLLLSTYPDFDPDSECQVGVETPPENLAQETPITSEPKLKERKTTESKQKTQRSTKSATNAVADSPADPQESQTKSESDEQADQILTHLDLVLEDAAFKNLSREELEQCVGVASHWGVPMEADFSVFRHLEVYTRGDVVGQRYRRSLKKFYRQELVDVPLYRRLVIVFQLNSDHERGETLSREKIHIRMFKNIPKQDVDMLLPGTKVRLSKFDRAKVIVPSLGGWLFSLQKISRFILVTLALAAYYSMALAVGFLLAAAAYVVKSFFSYSQTKNRYLLDVTRNLFYQKLDSNSGALLQLVHQRGRQTQSELSLAYCAMVAEGQPISQRRLRRKCERWIRELTHTEVTFSVDEVLKTLRQLNLVCQDVEGRWQIEPDQ